MKTKTSAATRWLFSVKTFTLLLALAFGAATAHANSLTWNTTSGAWDIGITANWTGDATLFANGDDVTFNNTSGGTVTIDASGVMPNSTTVSAASGTYIITGGPLGGSGTLTKSGGGTLTLSGANTYSGKTTVSAGTLSFNSIGNIGAVSSALGAPTTTDDGTINVTGALLYTGAAGSSDRVINTAGAVQINNSGSGLLTLTGGATGGSGELAFRGAQTINETGPIAHSGSTTHTDGGTVILGYPTNTFPGALNMKAGTISVSAISDSGIPSAIGQGTSLTFGQGVTYAGFGKLQFTGPDGGSCNRAITINSPSGTASGGIIENTVAGQTLILSGDIGTGGTGPTPQLQLIGVGNGELSGNIGGNGLTITMAGTGTWTLSGANYGNGTTVVSSGVLKIANPDALGISAIVTANGGQLDLNGISPNVGGITGTSGGMIINSSNTPVTLNLYNYGTSPNNYAGSIRDDGAANAIGINNAAGTQELSGANTYSGATIVSGGLLVLGTVGAATNSPITVYDGAVLGVAVSSPGTTFTPDDLTVGGGSGATINCFLGKLGNPTAPLVAPGTLVVNGTLTFSVSSDSANLTVGQPITLLKHASVASIPTALSPLPPQFVGHLVTNIPNSSIDLVLDCVANTIWVGGNSSDWDINGTLNWSNSCAGLIAYVESSVPGAAVTFDDTAVSSSVNLVTTVSPSAITVNNSVLNYTFSGYGTIAGPATLTKSGSAKLTVATDNTYTGGTVINGGTVSIGDGGTTGTLGTGSITDDGTLIVNHSDTRTISQLIKGTGSVVQAGPGQLNLSAANTYSGGTMFSGGILGIGAASVISGANIVSGATGVGGATLADGVTFSDTGNQWYATTVTLQGDITLNGNTRERVGFQTLDLGGGTRTIHLNGTGGNIVQTIPTPLDTSVMEGTGRDRWETQLLGTPLVVTNGSLILDSPLTGSRYAGFMFQNASSFANNVELTVGPNVYLQTVEPGSLGSTTNDAAKLTVNGVWTLDGVQGIARRQDQTVYSLAGNGRVWASMQPGTANPRKLWIIGTAGTTEFSGLLSDGTDSGKLALLKTGGSTQVLSGEVSYSASTTVSGGVLALKGGTSLANSTSIEVGDGATLDVAGRTDQTLTLPSGQTLSGGGSLNGSLVAQAGSIVSPGSPVGTLRVTNDITLAGTLLLELDRTNAQTCDQLVSVLGTITYGGMLSVTNTGPALKAGDLFHLFPGAVTAFTSIQLATNDATGSSYTWSDKVALDGSIEVLTAVYPVNTTPTNCTVTVSGNQLVLSWPPDHTGWHLQVQTNTLPAGLGTNWVTIPDTDLGNSYTNTIDTTQGSVFYRMVYP